MGKRCDWDQGRLEGRFHGEKYIIHPFVMFINTGVPQALVETGVVNAGVQSLEVTLGEPILYTQIGKLNKKHSTVFWFSTVFG